MALDPIFFCISAHFEPPLELKWALKECPAEYFVHVPEDFEVDVEAWDDVNGGGVADGPGAGS